MSTDVCILSTANVFGGAEVFQIRLAVLLRGHARFVVVSPFLPALKRGLAESGAEFVGLPAHGWLALRWALLHWLWCQRHAIRASGTCMVLNGRGAAYLAPMVRLLTRGAPIIISHTALSIRPGDLKEGLYGIAARFARCVVAVSDSVAAQHHQRWPHLPVKSIPNWINLQPGTPVALRPIVSHTGATLDVALVARLALQKGIEDVVAACAEEGAVELHIYGDGPMRDQLRDMGRAFPWLHFHGHVDDLPRRLPAHSILISGSYSESFSFAVAEGIHAGLLCVVTDIPAHRELLGVGYPDDLFFSAGDLMAMKRALRAARARLYKDHGEGARSVVSGAQAHIAKHNSPEVARQRYLAVLSVEGVGCRVQ